MSAIKYIIPFAVFLHCSSTISEERPLVLKEIMTNNETDKVIIYIQNLSQEQKDFYWKDTIENADGYFEYEPDSSSNQIHLIDEMYLISNKINITTDIFLDKQHPKNTIKKFADSANKIIYFVESDYGVLMLTKWDLVADKAKIYIVNDFLNVKIPELTGTLTLIKDKKNLNKCIWQLNWILNNIQYELTLPDKLDSQRKPLLNREKILDFIKNNIL